MDYIAKAQAWLSQDFDAETQGKVKYLMENDKTQLEDCFYKNLEFGTGGLRALMGVGTNRINQYTIAMVTQGFANYIKKQAIENQNKEQELSVCISYDCRNNQDVFSRITAEVLAANGIKVYLFESLRPTPVLSYAIRYKKAIAGIMLTASHNPKEYNGYKIYWTDGAQVVPPVDAQIVDEVNKITSPSMVNFGDETTAKNIIYIGKQVDEAYLKDVSSLLLSQDLCQEYKETKVVYSPLHGCGVHLLPRALREMGFKEIHTVAEQCINDGNFPTVAYPNPEEPAAMDMAKALANEISAEIVMDTDPDADRLGLAVRNDKGEIQLLNGNQTAVLLTYYILSRRKELGFLDSSKSYLVKTIVTTPLLKDIAKSFGLECYDVLTGFKYIAQIVKENEGKREFICGGEESFGFNVGEFVRDKDSIVTAMTVMEAACWAKKQGMSLFELLQKIYKEYGYRKETLVSLEKKGKQGIEDINRIMLALRENTPKEFFGIKVKKVIDYLKPELTGLVKSNVLQFITEGEDIISVRPSGTEPKIKFYLSVRGDSAEAKIANFKAFVSKF